MKHLKLFSILYYTGMALVLAGTIAALSKAHWGGYLMAAGVVPIVGIRLYNRIVAVPERQRINGILLMSSLVLTCGVVAFFMKQHYWVVCMFTTAVLDGYASFRRLT